MIKRILNLLITLIIVLISTETSIKAEFICTAEVHYKWVKPDVLQAKSAQPAAKSTPDTAVTPSADTTAPEFTVFWANIEKKAATEEDAKLLVSKAALNERAGAEKACLSGHENLSGCIAAKYATLSSSVSTLSFSARKSMDEAIRTDCDKQQGKCTGSSVGEVKCTEIKTEAKAEEAPAKDAKKKK